MSFDICSSMSPSCKTRYRESISIIPESSIVPCFSQSLHPYPNSRQFVTPNTMISCACTSYFCVWGNSFAQHNFWCSSVIWSISGVSSFFYWVVLHRMSTPEFVYSFCCFWTYVLFLVWGFSLFVFVLGWYEHSC